MTAQAHIKIYEKGRNRAGMAAIPKAMEAALV